MTDYQTQLRDSWHKFCDELKKAGDIPLRPMAAKNPVDMASAYRLLARNVGLALQFELDNCDPLHPELLTYFNPIRKQGGDNSDAHYVGAPINGTDTYRISGHRGSSRYFAVTVVETGDTPWGGGVAGMLFGDDVQVEEDGTFELWLSPEPLAVPPRNWMRTTPDSFRVTFRQFFADWEHEDSMQARIDVMTGSGAPPELTPEKVIDGLARSAHWVNWSVGYWCEMLEKWKVQPNTFLSWRQVEDRKIDATPGGQPMIAYWAVPTDEALIVRVRPPKAQYWSLEFGNYMWETMDYRYRLSSTNCHHATLEDDGELIVVISHDDPGLPNWLDPSGHSEGYMTFRWMLAETCPIPVPTQIKRADLFEHLPAGVKRVTPHERKEQLAERRRGIVNRFMW